LLQQVVSAKTHFLEALTVKSLAMAAFYTNLLQKGSKRTRSMTKV
jgi:hypothetical protein